MTNPDILPPHIDQLMATMEQICHDIAWGRYDRADELFNMTKKAAYPERIAKLAESFGMMLVKVEAREYRMDELLGELKRTSEALEISRRQLIHENAELKQGLVQRYSPKRIIGQSPSMQEVLNQIKRIADTSVNVLISGETGTGKELVAKALHYTSRRKAKPFVAMNCAAIPESLFESELFGIEKGVATGVNMRRGLVEQAQGGTLFLDEIGDMPTFCQGKILRILEERELTRVGGSSSIPVDIRVVAATNKNLDEAILAGRFRQDLFFRLNVMPLALPPLRERTEDIPLLLKRFLELHSREMNRPQPRIDKNAMAALLHYSWPGNVRQLENEVERLVALSFSTTIQLEDLSPDIRGPIVHDQALLKESVCRFLEHDEGRVQHGAVRPRKAQHNLASSEKLLISKALQAASGNKSQAARLLGITREGLRKKINRLFGPEPPEGSSSRALTSGAVAP